MPGPASGSGLMLRNNLRLSSPLSSSSLSDPPSTSKVSASVLSASEGSDERDEGRGLDLEDGASDRNDGGGDTGTDMG